MANKNMVRKWIYFCCSSSIINFREKLRERTGLLEWNWNIFSRTIFFGCYHIGDYIRILLHVGPRKVFWTGSDILNLTPFWARLLSRGRHYCENEVERRALRVRGIDAEVLPMIFTDFESEECFLPARKTHVFLTAHEGREKEYGIPIIVDEVSRECHKTTFHVYGVSGRSRRNVIFHGKVSEEQFDREIRAYHAALRLNEFDGMSEVVAKSILCGQYPISKIIYPHIETYTDTKDLIRKIRALEIKQFPNQERIYWQTLFECNLQILLT